MYKTFDEMINNCGCLSGSSLVAAAADRETIEAVKLAFDKGLGHAIFTGDERVIAPLVEEFGLADKSETVHAGDPVRRPKGRRPCPRGQRRRADEGACQYLGFHARRAGP